MVKNYPNFTAIYIYMFANYSDYLLKFNYSKDLFNFLLKIHTFLLPSEVSG